MTKIKTRKSQKDSSMKQISPLSQCLTVTPELVEQWTVSTQGYALSEDGEVVDGQWILNNIVESKNL